MSAADPLDVVRAQRELLDELTAEMWWAARWAIQQGSDPHKVALAAGVTHRTLYRRLHDHGTMPGDQK